MAKKCYLFSVYDMFNENESVQNEFLDKHLAIKSFFDDIELISFNEDLSTHPIVLKNNFKTRRIKNIKDFPDDGNYITFGNFLQFEFNSKYYRTGDTDTDGLKHKHMYRTFVKLNKFFNDNEHLKLFQYMSDPMDLKFDRAKIITPDALNDEYEEYFPLYQYYHFKNDEVKEKSHELIVGSTCYNEFRTDEFNKYLLPLYSEKREDDKYKFYISHYQNMFFGINNFIDHLEFFDEISRSKFGVVLKTYSGDMISANKVSQFLSKDCIPILVNGCDDRSNFIPKDLKDKYTINDGRELIKLMSELNYKDALEDWAPFKEYLDIKTSSDIINTYIINNF